MEFLNILRKEDLTESNKVQLNELFNLGFNNRWQKLLPLDIKKKLMKNLKKIL